jgi:hypothetical protein
MPPRTASTWLFVVSPDFDGWMILDFPRLCIWGLDEILPSSHPENLDV